ncbi:MAG: cellulose synthase subunit BcsC-related outer membrane protein [Vibrio sp.]
MSINLASVRSNRVNENGAKHDVLRQCDALRPCNALRSCFALRPSTVALALAAVLPTAFPQVALAQSPNPQSFYARQDVNTAAELAEYRAKQIDVIANDQPFEFNTNLAAVDSIDWLLKQAQYAQLLHRADITGPTLERLFAIEPNNAQGLAYQAKYLVETDKLSEAQKVLAQLKKQAPNAQSTKQLETYLSLYGANRSQYQQALLLTHAGRADEALKIYHDLFPNGMPTPQLQLEYLQLMDRKYDNWQKVQDGLIALNKQYPKVPDFQLALASHTLGDNPEDPAALAMIQRLTMNPNTSFSASAVWLKSLDQTYITPAVLKQYQMLAAYNPTDNEYQKAYQLAKKRIVTETELQKDPTYMAKLEGLALVKKEQYYAAERKLKIAESTRPHDSEILAALGLVYMRTGRQTLAVGYFQNAKKYETDLNKTPKWDSLIAASAYWANLDNGDAYLAKGNYAKAKQLYLDSVKLQPEDPYAYNSLANWAAVQKKYKESENYYLQSLKTDALNETALRGRINNREAEAGQLAAYSFTQTYTPAQQRVVSDRIKELHTNVLLQQVNIAITSGDMTKASSLLDQLAANPPQSPWDRANIAEAIRATGDTQRADDLMAKWSRDNDPQTRFAYALYLSGHGQTQQAIDVLSSVPKPQRTAAMEDNLQRLEMDKAFADATELAKTDKDAAKDKIDQMMDQYSDDPNAQVRLVGMEYRLGFIDLAKQQIQDIEPEKSWDYQTQLDYGRLLLDMQFYDDFAAWQKQLPEPTADANSSVTDPRLSTANQSSSNQANAAASPTIQANNSLLNYRLQRDLLFADYAFAIQDFPQAEEKYQAVISASAGVGLSSTSQNTYKVDAQFGLLNTYLAQEKHAQATELAKEMYRNHQSYTPYQLVQLATVLNEQGLHKEALEVAQQTMQTAGAGALEYRESMKVTMDNKAYPLSEKLAYKALAAQQAEVAQQSSNTGSTVKAVPTADDNQAAIAKETPKETPTLRDLYNNAGDDWISNGVKSDLDYIHARNDGYVEIGFDYSGRDSENQANQVPIEVLIPMPEYDGHLLLRSDVVTLDSGDLDYYDKSTGSDSDVSVDETATGVALGVGWIADTWSTDIGTTPLGFDSQTWVGGLNLSGDLADVGWKATFSRRAETSSTLSYSGMSVPDGAPVDGDKAGKHWGGVVSTGVKLGGSYDTGGATGYWWSGQFHKMTGENVEDNTRLALLGGSYYKILNERDYRLSVGLNSMYMHYDKNLSEYAYGYGGYYSPQRYFSLSLPINWYQRTSNTFSYLISGSVSNSWTSEDAPYLDQDGAGSETGGGFGYSLQVAAEQRVSARWYVGFTADIQRSESYEPNHIMMYMRYTFDDRWQPIAMPVDPLMLYADFD